MRKRVQWCYYDWFWFCIRFVKLVLWAFKPVVIERTLLKQTNGNSRFFFNKSPLWWLRASLHESRDEFHPGMNFVPGWKIFILNERVHPGMLGRKLSRPSWIHLARAYITLYSIPERLFTWRFSSRFIPGWHFIPVLRPGIKSSRNDFIPGRNHVTSCRQQQENDQTPRGIHPRTKPLM